MTDSAPASPPAARPAAAASPPPVADEPASGPTDAPPAASHAAGPTVPGERLGIPLGASRSLVDQGRNQPRYGFLFAVSGTALVLDIASKTWAERNLDRYPGIYEVIPHYLSLILAKNRGGAWGLLQTTSESIRRPFFLVVSVAAVAFIMTLYRRLQPRQRALRWGLPLVLGGALGNVFDRVRYGQVIDFIDAHVQYQGLDHHWPTFNVADVAICVGVGLMAIDMLTTKRGEGPVRAPRLPPAQSGEPIPDSRS